MELDVRGSQDTRAVMLPFLFDVVGEDTGYVMNIHNGEEIITVNDVVISGDSVHIRPSLFDSEFAGVLLGDSVITGTWYNRLRGPGYAVPFIARAGALQRFTGAGGAAASVEPTWACRFAMGTPDAYDAIGLFRSEGERLHGSFATETGDHRFLEGTVRGDSLMLSSFDGSHAFLYRAILRNDSLIGEFRSGNHALEPWTGVPDPDFRLRHPDSLTFLKEGTGTIQLRLPDLDGDTISLQGPGMQGRVRLVQIMGSWCPNCMDESRLLTEMYDRHHAAGLEIIAIAFEKQRDQGAAIRQLKRYKGRLGIPYHVLYGGIADQGEVLRKLPFLENMMSYPTCVFMDRRGVVRRIRTGFYGPGTGRHYQAYAQDLDRFLLDLLAEPRVTVGNP